MLSPGPTLPIHVSDAEKSVNISPFEYPSIESSIVDNISSNIHNKKKDLTFLSTSFDTGDPSNFVIKTARGWTIFLKSLVPDLKSIISLETFKPPPVEPPQAPSIVKNNNIAFDKEGQFPKSTFVKPVVEIIDDVWKNEYLKASKKDAQLDKIFIAITKVDISIIIKYVLNSSLLIALDMQPINIR